MKIKLLLLVVMLSGVRGNYPCLYNETQPCTSKCCELGMAMNANRKCAPSNLTFSPDFNNGSGTFSSNNCENCNLILLLVNPCPYERYRLEPYNDVNDSFVLFFNGSLLMNSSAGPVLRDPLQYCFEAFEVEGHGSMTLPLVCFEDPQANPAEDFIRFTLYPIGLLFSVPFLIMTAFFYLRYPQLRDLHGKALTFHVICLTVAYLSLAITQLGSDSMGKSTCIFFAYIIMFSFLAAFSWMNVMSIDAFWYILSVTDQIVPYPRGEQNKAQERKAFIGYSVYAWSIPVLMLSIVVIRETFPAVPTTFAKPNFGDSSCWFGNNEASLPYFYAPIAFWFSVNLVLFVVSLYKWCSNYWERTDEQLTPRQRVRMVLILFVTMGISWITELFSWAVGGPPQAWAVTDVINTLQGVIIFVIFVLEPRIKQQIFPCGRQQPPACPAEETDPMMVPNSACPNGRKYNFQ